MAHREQRDFCSNIREKYPDHFIGKKVLDIGSLDINGNNRFLFQDCDYIGLDVGEGKNVDVISVGHLYDAPDNYFDTIISTEVFEHDMFYEETIKNIIRMLKPGGAFIFTCAGEGRPEHGTRRCGEFCAPLLTQISNEWADYYKNLMQDDFLKIQGFTETFPDGWFIYNQDVDIPSDLYFFGVKGGILESQKYLPRLHNSGVMYNAGDNREDIFVLGAWPNTDEKEKDLLECISRLRSFHGIPILLVSHYPIKAEIQKLVDYYIFDKDNDILRNDEFESHSIASGRWTKMSDHKVINEMPFHHDYAIWVSMKHAFNFCKYLGKSRVHYLEYDNLIDPFQWRQAFLEKSFQHDAVLYEYHQNSTTDSHLTPFCATFIFSAKTDILVSTISEVNSKMEYFSNRPTGWQLERLFIHYLKKHTNDIFISPYIANNNELNTQAVWNRDGILRAGYELQIYTCIDDQNKLYLHLINGFHGARNTEDVLVEVRYDNTEKFVTVLKDEYKTIPIGDYKRGHTARVFLLGVEVFSEFLDSHVDEYRKLNRLIWNPKPNSSNETNDITMTFVDGPFVEILGNLNKEYLVKFIDDSTDETIFQTRIKNNQWARCSRKWFVNWRIEIHSENESPIIHRYDAKNKRVYISFESSSLGDTLAWIPYVEEFRKKHDCHLLVTTFLNDLLKDQYPDIEFVPPRTVVENVYALYRIGCFYDNDMVDMNSHKTDFRNLRLQEYATDILGLDFEELQPHMPKLERYVSDKPYICIANHSTAQSKYWNNPTGWQELVDYVKSLGYDVYLLSREEDGYMGNKNPKGVIKVDGKSLEEIGSILLGSQGFIGLGSGLSWLSWALQVPTILISGFSEPYQEMKDVHRIINEDVCHGCFARHLFDKGDWNWCPDHKGTDRQFECTKSITFQMVKPKIDKMLNL